jgi:PAS domain S-box-containing protein
MLRAMHLRTKLLAGIQVILLLQILITGGFTLRIFSQRVRTSTRVELEKNWGRVRSAIDALKHTLYIDIHQLLFFLNDPRSEGASRETQRGWIRYFISLTDVDRALLFDGEGTLVVDEWAGIPENDGLLPGSIDPGHFRFPRNEFVAAKDRKGAERLYLVTGATLRDSDGGIRMLYLITNMDKSRTDSIGQKTGANFAFFTHSALVACNVADFRLDEAGFFPYRVIDIGNHPYEIFPGVISYDVPEGIMLISLASLVSERLLIREILFFSLTAFLLTLAASMFLATGITVLLISPFRKLNQWLHGYMDTGRVQTLNIRTRDEVGFLAGAFHAMIADLIEEKRVESEQLERIKALETYARSIMNDIKAAIAVTGADGRIEFCNTYLLELLGTDFGELRGSDISAVLQKAFNLNGMDWARSIPMDRETSIEGLTLDRAGAEAMRFTAKASPIRLEGGRMGSLIVLEDITATQKLWERMMIADKVTSLGILSAGIAHEINNPLGSILSHVKYLKAVENEAGKIDSLSWIETETERIASLIRRIRAYTAPPPGNREACSDMNLVVRQTMEVLAFTLEERGLNTRLELAEGLPPAACPADELQQVVMNIVLNACQASAPGSPVLVNTAAGGEGNIRLLVADRGTGMDEATLKNIFDPFFTTKAGDGSGLGLSICFAIVKRAGGNIRVHSTPGAGTEVEVTLNVHERAHR